MTRVWLTCLLLAVSVSHASADFPNLKGEPLQEGTLSVARCLAAATKVIHGQPLVLEFKSEEGTPIYEFEIKAKDGLAWNVEVNANIGFVGETEKHVKADDTGFKAYAKISAKQAEKIATAFVPGMTERREYLIEDDGGYVYEFDIHSTSGGEFKVEIDAASGEVHRVNPAFWEIGELDVD